MPSLVLGNVVLGSLMVWLGTSGVVAADSKATPVPAAPASITIDIDGSLLPGKPPNKITTLCGKELVKMPRQQVHVGSNKLAYEGVALAVLLEHGGMKWIKDCSPALASYVLVEASDGYRAVFALPEIHPAYRTHMTILADQADGHALQGNEAPWRLVEEREGFSGRWVRQVTKITVRAAATTVGGERN